MALGLIDNATVSVPVLVQLVARGGGPETFGVRWDAAESLVRIAKRGSAEATLCERHGLGEYDLRETLQQALTSP